MPDNSTIVTTSLEKAGEEGIVMFRTMKVLKAIYALKFETFLKTYIFFLIARFLITTISNYFWPNHIISSRSEAIIGIFGLLISIPIIIFWLNKIKIGSKIAYTLFKWITILSLLFTPVSYLNTFQTAKILSAQSIYTPGFVINAVLNPLLLLFALIYITHFWNKKFPKK